ncbi:alpha/beta hydrolase [Vallitalea pronyensis]|uniref:Alpha/beta hydrolase n=1 Tax=Vallitalea pronyensis TaxID=1348613 RepID=A0A8J8MII3_9FIRM|nr:alpha/beta hydrolase [Vallitalea pronyensis]QUI22072.1 alpha/beta hydrolase [Vallitalea pronyensis]
MKKKLLFIGIILMIVIGVVAFIMIRMTGKPLYTIGNVKKEINLRAPLEPPIQSGNIGYFQVEEDIKLNYFTQGTGDNILILHGGPGMPYAEEWKGLDELSKTHRFIYYDQRGSGSSTRPINTFSSKNYYKNMLELESTLGLTAQIADIERIRRILGEEKLTLIGHSFGAVLASLYATEFPENVESLILVAPAPLLKMPLEVPGLFDNIEGQLQEEDIDDYSDFLKRYFDYKNLFKKSEEELVALNNELGTYFYKAYEKGEGITPPKNAKAGGWMVQAIYLSMGQKYDYTESISKVKVPTLIIHTGNDFVQDEKASQLYLDVFPHAKYVVMDRAGHMPFNDLPNEFSKIVDRFLGDIE